MNLLQLTGIHKKFGSTVALAGVDLTVKEGEVHALIGENGAGKSTLMHILSGSLKPDAGTMMFKGISYNPASPMEARLQGIAFVHQELCLCPHLTVAENILLGTDPEKIKYGITSLWNDSTRLQQIKHIKVGYPRNVSEKIIEVIYGN